MTAPEILTFGCRLNAYESEVIRGHAERAGLGEVVIVNSCAVTAEAERQVRQAIRRARRRHPTAEIVVTGCAAQIDPATYAAMAEVDRVIGNEEKLKAETWGADRAHARVAVNDIMALRETASHLVSAFAEKTRAFVQIQQGCDHRCTFCIIPFGRGNNRSVPLGEIVGEVRRLTQASVKEVVLTGVDITGYGSDLPGRPTLGQLCRRLLALVPELPRLRLSSVDPVELDEDLYRLLESEPRLMPHLHLSMQAGDDMILKRMKRRHLRADVLATVERVRRARPEVVFGADLIAGFPTETDAMFQRTAKLVEEAGLTYLHVFPYSERPGTPAARMPQVPVEARRERAARLRALGETAVARHLATRLGQEASVLVEEAGQGHAEDFVPVAVAAPEGSIVRARLVALDGNRLLGQAA